MKTLSIVRTECCRSLEIGSIRRGLQRRQEYNYNLAGGQSSGQSYKQYCIMELFSMQFSFLVQLNSHKFHVPTYYVYLNCK